MPTPTHPAPDLPMLRIFYDGGCGVCAWEVDQYLARDRRRTLGLIDINDPEFAAKDYGLDAARVRKHFHVLTADENLIVGVDAFIKIWETLGTPAYQKAARIARWRPVHLLLILGYAIFAEIRPALPRRRIT